MSKFVYIKIMLHGFNNNDIFSLDSKKFVLNKEFISVLEPISTFDPQGVNNIPEGYYAYSFVIRNESNRF